jgi:hypothetical protein
MLPLCPPEPLVPIFARTRRRAQVEVADLPLQPAHYGRAIAEAPATAQTRYQNLRIVTTETPHFYRCFPTRFLLSFCGRKERGAAVVQSYPIREELTMSQGSPCA